MKTILIVEDDNDVREDLRILLSNEGYGVEEITDFQNVEAQLFASKADLVLLDINLPGINGEELLRRFRKQSQKPVIMVTSRTSETDEVLSMSYGADDYITKPYHPMVLLLRIAALFRRTGGAGQVIRFRNLEVSPSKGLLSNGTEEIILTKNEMIIFETLLNKQGQIVSREELMTALWDNEEYVNDNALTVNISRLRSKLASLGYSDALQTRKKQGYVLSEGRDAGRADQS